MKMRYKLSDRGPAIRERAILLGRDTARSIIASYEGRLGNLRETLDRVTEPCEKCKGRGSVTIGAGVGYPGVVYNKCPACSGSGLQPKGWGLLRDAFALMRVCEPPECPSGFSPFSQDCETCGVHQKNGCRSYTTTKSRDKWLTSAAAVLDGGERRQG